MSKKAIIVISNISNYIEKFTNVLVNIILILMVFVGFLHVFYRYVLNDSLSWSDEFLIYSLSYYCLLSASIILKKKGHIGIVFIRDKMPENIKKYFLRISDFIEVFVSLIVSIFGIKLIFEVQDQITPALQIKIGIPLFAVALSFIFMLVYALEHVINDFFKR